MSQIKRQRLKTMARLSYGDSLPDRSRDSGKFLVMGSNGAVGNHSRANTTGETIVIGRKGSFGKVRYSPEPVFVIDTAYYIDSKAASVNLRWLGYVLSVAGLDTVSRDTGIPGLSRDVAHNTMVPVVEETLQRLIVRYLDHAELRIAKAIAAKRAMLALLAEREELAIIDAITGSSKPRTSDSRVEWLGEFPSHWEVKRLGSVLVERREMNTDRRVQQVLSLVRKKGVMRYEDKGRIGNKRSEDVARYKVVRDGDIVLNSMNVIIGSVGQSGLEGCLSPVYYVLRPIGPEHHGAYFNALFQIERFHSSLVRFGKGILAHRMRIPMLELKSVMLPVPPLEEQVAIANRVEDATASLRRARTAIEDEITLLKEYRTRLISDVVTGKIDVREEAAKLPDIDPAELAAVLAGGAAGADEEEAADGED